ncbi:MAG TPA: hypothetical protein EYO01_04025 [Phycisphaerales bacterium]|nr:hypothetical protein [Phycisphaerales bacterium]HIN84105.1 hypothetical protein [Phycisphaerales bacterium]
MTQIIEHFIDGKRVQAASDSRCNVLNPATKEVIAEIMMDEVSASAKAVESSRCAFLGWSETPVGEKIFVFK